MPVIKHNPMTFATLSAFLGDKDQKKIAPNTFVEGHGSVRMIRLYETVIMTFEANGLIILNSGGFRTVTTKARINQFLPASVGLGQRKGAWFVRALDTDIKFEEGFRIITNPATGEVTEISSREY